MDQQTSIRRRLSPSVSVTIDFETAAGKEVLTYKLAFNFGAFAAIEAKTGLNMLKGELFKNINVTNLVAMFWAALLIHQPEFATDDGYEFAAELVTMENSAQIITAVKNAFVLSLPKAKQEEIAKEEAEKAARGPQGGAPAA